MNISVVNKQFKEQRELTRKKLQLKIKLGGYNYGKN